MNSSATSAAPPNGMSLQRVSGQYVLHTPTPNAVNQGTPVLPDAGVIDAPPDMVDAGVRPDAGGGGGNNNGSDDDGCSAGAGASWFGLLMLVGLLVLRRSHRA